jgi:hypothetical protein
MKQDIEALIAQLRVAQLAAKAIEKDDDLDYYAERFASGARGDIGAAIENLTELAKAMEGL